jgi:hypothetical protein
MPIEDLPPITVEFRTKRHNLSKLLIVVRKWGISVNGVRRIDATWILWVACERLLHVQRRWFICLDETRLLDAVPVRNTGLYPVYYMVSLSSTTLDSDL